MKQYKIPVAILMGGGYQVKCLCAYVSLSNMGINYSATMQKHHQLPSLIYGEIKYWRKDIQRCLKLAINVQYYNIYNNYVY